MYEQRYIDMFGEKVFENIITNNIVVDINNKSFKDRFKYFAFQHYLLKCYINKTNYEKTIKYINKMYEDFQKYPHMFVNSPLLKNNVIEALFKGDNVEIVKNIRNTYYSNSILLEYSKRANLTEMEKNRFYAILILHIKTNNPKIKNIIENEINKIVNTKNNIKDFNDMELQFYAQYVSNFSNNYKDDNTIVMIGEEEESKHGVSNSGLIAINKNSTASFEAITKTICHETQHFNQYKDSKIKNNVVAYEMAQRYLFAKYLNNEDYDSYKSNYRYSGIELDAEKTGHWKAGVFFTTLNRPDLSEKVRNNRVQTLDRRNYYSFMYDTSNKPIPTDSFYVTNFDSIINKNPKELENFPVLKNLYNDDGSRKHFTEILYARINQDINNRGIFDNYINYGIMHNGLNGINEKALSPQLSNKMFETFSNSYRDTIIILKDYLDDELDENKLTNFQKKQVEKTTNYQINLAKTILSYVYKNFDLMMKNYDKKLTNTNCFVYNYIYDLRDFNIDDIKNPIIMNSSEVLNNIKDLKKLSNAVTQKYNMYFAYGRIKELPQEKQYAPMASGEPFNEFIIKLSLKMDSHQYVEINGKKQYIGDVIRQYDPSKYEEQIKRAM